MHDFAGKTVFIAEVSSGMKAFSENLIRELERYGCEIKTIAKEKLQISNAIDVIKQCDFAIHMLSEQDRFTESLEETQIEQSVKYFHSRELITHPSFEIFAWYPKFQNNKQFGDAMLPNHVYNVQQLEEVELLRMTFEEFKNYIFHKLVDGKEEPIDGHNIKGDEHLHIYFIYDAEDREFANQYVDFLKKRGFTVVSPAFISDLMEVRHRHNIALKNFDLAIIFAQNAGINWINMKIMDVLKSPGLGRERDILGKAIFAPDQMTGKLTSNSKGFDIISTTSNTIQDQVDLFLKRKNLR